MPGSQNQQSQREFIRKSNLQQLDSNTAYEITESESMSDVEMSVSVLNDASCPQLQLKDDDIQECHYNRPQTSNYPSHRDQLYQDLQSIHQRSKGIKKHSKRSHKNAQKQKNSPLSSSSQGSQQRDQIQYSLFCCIKEISLRNQTEAAQFTQECSLLSPLNYLIYGKDVRVTIILKCFSFDAEKPHFTIAFTGKPITVIDHLRRLIEEEIETFCATKLNDDKIQDLKKSLFIFAKSPKQQSKNLLVVSKKEETEQLINQKEFDYWLYIPSQRDQKWFDTMKEGAQFFANLENQNGPRAIEGSLNQVIEELKSNADLHFKSDRQASIEQLKSQLEKKIRIFGGYKLALDIEDKARDLVQEVLIQALDSHDELQIDMEITLDLFGRIRPDICIIERAPHISEYIKCLKSYGHMHYLIEVKKESSKSSDSFYDNHFKHVRKPQQQQSKSIDQIANNLRQNMDQLRRFCLIEQEPEVYGILTNFNTWYFTKYSLNKELSSLLSPEKKVYESEINPFEISQPIRLFKNFTQPDQSVKLQIDIKCLNQLVVILETLYTYKREKKE
ncbi:hypothetical protein FGO68_gene5050 [Halteria grandinella]|uniref:Uncharacterized protein n=1 Tax=Halteria grandinella TaxID=5974 RepID=A0A8J8NWR0_HALGN|nr:hypothetical protein FGO68_gene5050 [Halteria grandinella]